MYKASINAKAVFALIKSLGRNLAYEVVSNCGEPKDAFEKDGFLDKICGVINADLAKKAFDEADRDLIEYQRKDIALLCVADKEYPKYLKEIDEPPLLLYLKGKTELLNTKSVAVVGTRRPTRYGVKVAKDFTREFALSGLTVVSGMARGIDTIAHQTALEAEAPTIAVMGCGLDICYPAENRALKERIEKEGLAVSEYPLSERAQAFHFPERNRIISGLSLGVFIPEATLRSGSLITARLAVEQGRELFLVPGNINSPASEGCNEFLKEMPAALTTTPEDVLRCLGIEKKAKEENRKAVQIDAFETIIVELLHGGELHFEELLEKTNLAPSELTVYLMNLELNGVVEKLAGNFYALV